MGQAQNQFDEDYLYIRKQLVAGRSPFITADSAKQWLRIRTEKLVDKMIEERWRRMKKNLEFHAEREIEFYDWALKKRGEKKDEEE